MSKDVWDDIGRAVTKAADTLGCKADELASVARLKHQIYSLERDIRRSYKKLGKI